MIRNNRKYAGLLIGLGLLPAACSLPQGDFPSLSKRAYEDADPIATPTSEPATLTTTLPDSLRTALDVQVARHNAADAAFQAALPKTLSAARAAASSTPGSENWIVAHMEVSRLEEKRADSLAALAEIDKLIEIEREKGADAGLVALMAPAQEKVQREVDAQTAILVGLTSDIG